MPRATLTRVVRFRAEHRYHRADWDEPTNRAAFGDAVVSHAHDYRVEVSVRGPVDPGTGFVTDLVALDALLDERVVDRLDGRSFESVVARFASAGLQPSTEEIARWIWEEVAPRLQAGSLSRVRVRESDDLWADYLGPTAGDGEA